MINRDRHAKIVADTFGSIDKLNRSKGVEYTGHEGADNVHANFDRLARDLKLTPEQVLMVYLTKHLDSIKNYVNMVSVPESEVPVNFTLSEPIEGRIDDAILYLILLKGMCVRVQLVDGGRKPSLTHPQARQALNEEMEAATDRLGRPGEAHPNVEPYRQDVKNDPNGRKNPPFWSY